MGWKKKEKELSLDEALDLARKEQAPYWLQSPPLVTAFPRPEGGHAAFALDPGLVQNRWLAAFMDPFSVEGVACLQAFSMLRDRYERFDLKPLVFVRSRYERLHGRDELGSFLRESRLPVVAAVDGSGFLQGAYGFATLPALGIISEGVTHREEAVPSQAVSDSAGLPEWLSGFEASLQRFLRITDPGLPLPPVLDFSAMRFAKTRRSWMLRSEDGRVPVKGFSAFAPQPTGWLAGTFPPFGDTPAQGMNEIELAGAWSVDSTRLVTQDPSARLRLKVLGSTLRCVAAPLHAPDARRRLPPVRISVTVNGLSVFEEQAGADIRGSEEGGTEMIVLDFGFREILRDFDRSPAEVTLSFSGVEENPVVLYGIELGSRT